ncbi:hypothetical protein D3C78_1805980 [compost metagenome]
MHRAGPAFDFVVLQRQVLGRLIGEQGAHFLRQLAEILGADIVAAHQADLVTDQWVTNLEHGHGEGSPAGWKKSAVA